MGWLFRVMSRLPLAFLHALGAGMGWVVFWASGTYRRRFHANVAQAGVAWGDARPAVAAAGRMVAELPWLWYAHKATPFGAAVQWRHAERVQQALAEKRGLVMLTPHMGSFEVTAQAFAERFMSPALPLTVLYRPARQAALREVMAGSRERPGLATAPATLAGVRQMLRALRRGEVVGLLPDQVPPDGLGVWAPFFGQPAYTMTLAARLVQQTGAALLLIWGERLPGGQGFVVHVEPAPQIAKDAPPAVAAAALNAAMEDLIRRAPGQYLWGYHRYKQPRGLDIGAAPDNPAP
jgi:KDO2-lipid IV(A) lauroyltransferase